MKEVPAFDKVIKLAFEASPLPLALCDAAGRVLRINAAFEAATGFDASALSETSLLTLLSSVEEQNSAPELSNGWQGVVSLPTSGDAPVQFFLRISDVPTGAEKAEVFLLSFSGVRNAEEQAAGFQQQKLESLGVLASSIAHDLNNILTGVLGHISYLRLSLPQTLSHQESISAIEDGARRAASMTRQILEFAKGEEVELCTVNLSMVVAAGINLLRASISENVALQWKGAREDIYVYGDESQLSQLVMNLTVNAQDAVRSGGTGQHRAGKEHFTGSRRLPRS